MLISDSSESVVVYLFVGQVWVPEVHNEYDARTVGQVAGLVLEGVVEHHTAAVQ